MSKIEFVLLFIIFTLFSCAKKENTIATKVLCHRGSGVGISIFKGDTIYENTLNAVKFGFAYYDGVEIDIQKSKSGTLWVFHNSNLYQIDSNSTICVPCSSDEQLIELNDKLPKYKRLTTLETVLKYRQSLTNTKYISLDVKGYFESNCIPKRNVSKEYEIATAKEIVRLINKYNLQKYVLVETDYLDVLKTVKSLNPRISCFVLGYNNFDEHLNTVQKIGVDGLSFNYNDSSLTQQAINKLHNLNMKIQVWTIRNEKELKNAKILKVDFIQTDH